jgi:hypothetical protein
VHGEVAAQREYRIALADRIEANLPGRFDGLRIVEQDDILRSRRKTMVSPARLERATY